MLMMLVNLMLMMLLYDLSLSFTALRYAAFWRLNYMSLSWTVFKVL